MDWIISKGKKELKVQLKKPDMFFDSWKISYKYRMNGEYIQKTQPLHLTALGKKKVTCVCGDNAVQIVAVISNEEDHLTLKYTIDSLSDTDIQFDSFTTITKLSIPKTDEYQFFKNGYQSWSVTRSYSGNEKEFASWLRCMNILQDTERNLPTGEKGSFHSSMFAVAGSSSSSYCLIGQGKPFNQYVYVNSKYENSVHIHIQHDFGGIIVKPASKLRADLVHILTNKNANDLFEKYFQLIRTHMPTRKKNPKGWCSWYYYFTKIDEKCIYGNLNALAEKKKRFDVFQIDDGYQTAVGDWLSVNEKFPGGMKPIAERIRTMGMIPGLWLAPFIAERTSQLYKNHPEWFLHDEHGKPVPAGWNPNWDIFGYFYACDTTHPEFQDYIKNVISAMIHEWGFGYLKLDFVYAASLYGKAYDMSFTSAQRLKIGYNCIREITGDKIFLLGCGAPLSSSIGLVDGMRIGPDVAPYWMATYRYYLTRDPHALCTKYAIRSIINRSQMHKLLWLNDPDCVMVRQKETKLTKEERMSLINAVIITGGMYFISDNLSSLNADDWKLIDGIDECMHHCSAGKSYPVDIMDSQMPEIVYNSSGYIAFFNFSDRTRKTIVQLKGMLKKCVHPANKLIDVWGKRTIYIYSDHLDLGELKPHESILCKII